MNLSLINTVDYGSTGKIMLQLTAVAEKEGFAVTSYSRRCLFPRKKINHRYFGFLFENFLHRFFSSLCGVESLMSVFGTISLCRYLRKTKTELIHLHNIHGHFLCFPIFFHFVKQMNIRVVWTLHDCWNFTGRCPYFNLVKCDKWKGGCHKCPYPRKQYPRSYVDTSRVMWSLKRKCFTGIKCCTLVAPSEWLAGIIKQSFLKDYPIKVIYNGIDLSVFKPLKSDFREKNNLIEKKIVLGVAFGWGKRKGLDVFIELSRLLPADYSIVLVGTNDDVDKTLPTNVISIHRTQNQIALAKIYTAADVFVNPTREEVLGLVNVESLACGTPVVTFGTGGSPECIDESCGSVVPCDDIDAMKKEICRICEQKPYSKEACLRRAKKFDMNERFKEYVDLYREMGG